MKRMRSRIAVLASMAAVAVALPVAVAEAAAPPKGTYDCHYISGRTFGLISIVSGSKYQFNRKKSGSYGSSGRKIKFRSGPMKGVWAHAEWKRGIHGLVYINLYDGSSYGHTDTDAQCLKRKS